MKIIEGICSFIIRGVFGLIGIYAINAIFSQIGVDVFVGINGLTLGTVTILGLPGIVLLYGIVSLDKM